MGDKSPKNKKKQLRRVTEKKASAQNTQSNTLAKSEQ